MAIGSWPVAVFLVASMVASFPTYTSAQVLASFDELPTRLRSGDTVYVLDGQGSETKGRVVQVSRSSLAVLVDGDRRDLSPLTVKEIWRRGDSVLNGLVIGAVGGVLAGGFLGGRNPGEKGSFWPELGFFGGLIGAGLGVAVDAVIPGKRLVYRTRPGSVSSGIVISPVFSSAGVGLGVTARF